MTKRVRFITAAAVLYFLALPATTQAQTAFLWGGGGVTFGTGGYGDVTDAGWMGTIGVGINIGDSGAAVFGEGIYGQNGISGDVGPGADESFKLLGAMAGLIYRAGNPENVGPFIWGGAGLLSIDDGGRDETHSGFGYEAGVGLDVPFGGNVGGWVEVRYMGSTGADDAVGEVNASVFGIVAGLGVALGG